MKERPIIFKDTMVRAILYGRKTQTRRVINPQPVIQHNTDGEFGQVTGLLYRTGGHPCAITGQPVYVWGPVKELRCPYGQTGDQLWVKETHYRYGKWVRSGKTKSGLQRWRFRAASAGKIPDNKCVYYLDDPPTEVVAKRTDMGWHKRPSIFMPRWASRITLEVTGVRVERIQDISEADAKAEGLACITKDGGRTWKYGIPDRDGLPGSDDDGWSWCQWMTEPRHAFTSLWDSINSKRGFGWDANPWVWVIEFKKELPRPNQLTI